MAKKKAPDEIDLHRLTVDEALPLVDDFLNSSYRAHLRRVWIVHGKGTGTLRNAVWDHVRRHRLVMHCSMADAQRGGPGCTQVDLVD
ncbi:MAG: Smr/MutS family protein [Dehalococcoidia bacterium]|nr:Smr/MutS family protein [Dehalococcoidia bacterium]